MSEQTEPPSIIQGHDTEIGALLETLLAVETLEYHNQNWLRLGPNQRSECKRALLMECLRHFPTTAKNDCV